MRINNNFSKLNSFKILSNLKPQNRSIMSYQSQKADSVSFGGNYMEDLSDFVYKYTKLIPANMADEDDVNLTFFAVRKNGDVPVEEFRKLAKPIKEVLEKEGQVSYLQIGGIAGSQRVALAVMGLGDLLGEWKVYSPDIVASFLPKSMKEDMAGMGMVTIGKIINNK